MPYFLLTYFNAKPLHVSSRLAVRHQEDQLCIDMCKVDWVMLAAAVNQLYQLLSIHSWPSWWWVARLLETCRGLLQSFIHSVVRLTIGPKALPKRAIHMVPSKGFSFKWEYPFLFSMSSSSFLCLLPRLLVTSILPYIFPSITRCRRQFQRKMWPIQFAFRLRISCRIFLCSLTLSNTS
jgi:hypothetical protein